MPCGEIHKDDIGTDIIITVRDCSAVIDLSTATGISIVFRKPSMNKLTVAGTLVTDGTDGKVHYVTVAGDLDEIGTWQQQVIVTFSPTNIKYSDIENFKVFPNL